MIKYRKSTRDDLEAVLDLIAESFSLQGNNFSETEGHEHRVLFSYLYSRQGWNPDWLYLAEQDDILVAAVGVFPQTLSFEEIGIPVWAISPVVTHPNYREQGLARECLNKVFENLRMQGIPAVFLWGLPRYYPKLGFVPLLPRYKTKITQEQLTPVKLNSFGEFRNCNFQDLIGINELYYRNNKIHWLQPLRSLQWWQERYHEMDIELAVIKEIPFPKKGNFLVWENQLGEVSGYLNYKIELKKQKVIINDAIAGDPDCALAMLQRFVQTYLKSEQTLYIQGTPEHFLNIAAYRLGGIHLNPAPLAGMVKIIDWPGFINFLHPLFIKRMRAMSFQKELESVWIGNDLTTKLHLSASAGFKMEFSGKHYHLNNPNTNQLLTKLIFGLYDKIDLEGVNADSTEIIQNLFPAKYPFIWDANYLY